MKMLKKKNLFFTSNTVSISLSAAVQIDGLHKKSKYSVNEHQSQYERVKLDGSYHHAKFHIRHISTITTLQFLLRQKM